MILGMIILRRRYTLTKKMSVAMVSVGIAICSLASGRDMMNRTTNQLLSGGFTPFFWWCVGVAMLTVSLFLAARLGIFQETLYQKYGKHPRESLFYSHAIPLFGFFFAWKDISNHMGIFNNSEPLCIFSVCLPSLWWGLLGNIATQYLCIRAVYFLTTEFSSLSVTLINTLRKFVSLVISIVYFQNVFTTAHWAGTILVFGGTLLFVDVFEWTMDDLKCIFKLGDLIWNNPKEEEIGNWIGGGRIQ
ncbi:unnamed protein product [Cyprideis torosa]|uniref:Uncharacterized protein n=1 Tax=Cyprideis torosa TaxID=163714 RepID=A0A7R8ZTN1_9CRUS|nr:unnamed protein product [Cyprideis torosa]CAG0898396.1 unnamed protein product [Cyprideis torosa]